MGSPKRLKAKFQDAENREDVQAQALVENFGPLPSLQ
jgi:hypothetical protein